MNFDLFPTILELAGIDSSLDGGQVSKAQSLLRPVSGRKRMSQYPAVFTEPFSALQKKNPDWDSTPWHSRLYALQEGKFKIICGKESGPELYDVDADPGEINDSADADPARTESMSEALHEFLASTRAYESGDGDLVEMTPEHRERLEALGYVISGVESGRSHADRTREINRAWQIISRDLRQFVARPVRDEFGAQVSALTGGERAKFFLSFTRGGWSNPNQVLRSNLQRVRYQLEDDVLWQIGRASCRERV